MLASPQFEAIWQCIKRWDINAPAAYAGYMGATGNHVRAILDALAQVGSVSVSTAERADERAGALAQEKNPTLSRVASSPETPE